MSLYDEVIQVAREYMGVAAEGFIAKRYKVIIGGDDPRGLKTEDVPKLASAVGVTAGAYMSDEQAERFKQDVLKLGHG